MAISNWKHLGEGTIYLALSGEVSGAEHSEMAGTLEEIARESGFETVILDDRDLEVTEDTEEAREAARDLGEVFAKAGVKRVVFIVPEELPGMEPFEEAFKRRGGSVETHPDFKSAVQALDLSYSGPSPRIAAA